MTTEIIICTYIYNYIYNLLDEIELEEDCVVTIVDNGGEINKKRLSTRNVDIYVLSPGENLGWCRGNNYALADLLRSRSKLTSGVLLLNDDVSISPGFVSGLREASKGKHVVGPYYDCVWEQQRLPKRYIARQYPAKSIDYTVNFIDGTAMYIPMNILQDVGLLDSGRFGQYGWGADFDYSIRTYGAGYSVVATMRSYLNHIKQGTAKDIDGYEGKAGAEMNAGMRLKYGKHWKSLLGL